MSAAVATIFSPVRDSFPCRSPRGVNDACRSGQITGARKIGGAWFWSSRDAERFASGEGASVVTEADALEDLRKRGVL